MIQEAIMEADVVADEEDGTGATTGAAMPEGVRTYRGRKLEDVLPQIREELGPDAIILREREGLVGGFGGFFAQRFVEVEARPGGPSIDVYDDEEDAAELPAADETPEAPAAAPETDAFVAKLREAAAAWTEDDAPVAALPGPVDAESTAVEEPAEVRPAPEPKRARKPRATKPAATKKPPAAKPKPKARTQPARKPKSPGPAPTAAAAAAAEKKPLALAAGPEPAPAEAPVSPAAVAVRAPAPATAPSAPGTRRGLRGILARWIRPRRRAPEPLPRPAAAQPLDAASAATVVSDLTACGGSQLWATQLVGAAGAHGTPLIGSDGLRGAAQRELARRIVAAPALPAGGAAIAFVGAGGAGKSRCTAALASAYRRASTLAVSVVALGTADEGRELAALLAEDGVPVIAATGDAAAARIADARQGGLVIVDTPPTTPTDPAAITALGDQLEPLSLDAVYVTLPATLGAQAARRVLGSFGSLRPAAMAITHADETDQLGVAVEIATTHRIPLVYVHAGTDIHRSLTAVEPTALARHLLP